MKQVKKIFFLTLLLSIFNWLSLPVFAQQPEIMNSAKIKIALEKLQVLGSALYIGAHPDDENTALLAWLSREKKMRAAYLSVTRGEGGQNLLGTEKGPLMGVLRTYELLQARQIDGAEQFFTRAVDFGYSKTAKESLAFWGKENILEDMVYVIRKFQPDVLFTRFPADPAMGGGHGHHTASSILMLEAFKAAGDASKFPEQLKYVSPWQPKRILWNTWQPYMKDFKPEDLVKFITLDVAVYNPLLGQSYDEIAALSRSMHKSQGFGAIPRRNMRLEYFQVLDGEPAQKDLFEGIDMSWNRLRVPGAEKVRQLLEKANQSFQFEQPQKILPLLLEALSLLKTLPPSYWTLLKTKELEEVIRSCAGLWLDAAAETPEVIPGQEIKVNVMAINRSDFPFSIKKIIVPGENKEIEVNQPLPINQPLTRDIMMKITETEYTQPYWLKEKPQKGINITANHENRGLAVAPYPFNLTVILAANGREVSLETPVIYRQRDPVEGEKIQNLVVTPPATVNFTEEVFYFPGKESQTIAMILRSGPAPVTGTLKLILPASWKVEPSEFPFKIDDPFSEKKASFIVTPPAKDSSVCAATAEITVGDRVYDRSKVTIRYTHVPLLTLHPKAEARLVRIDLKRNGQRIGYIMGSGDDIPGYLTQVGFRIDLLSDEDLFNRDLAQYDAIITGVRAYNTRDTLKFVQGRLLEYAANGGRLILQYNVARGLKIEPIGPYPIQLSQQRVSEEDAVITLLDPTHPLFHFPNEILPSDFDGWVQERGLYFADKWDEKYTALLSCHDEGEEPQKGGLLFTRYGKGVFIYTGYSFFRQLPAGVPGALKLFVNMISFKNASGGHAARAPY
jgi:LmbE family N-acetylglucosaminyl deacetylase